MLSYRKQWIRKGKCQTVQEGVNEWVQDFLIGQVKQFARYFDGYDLNRSFVNRPPLTASIMFLLVCQMKRLKFTCSFHSGL